MTTTTKTMSSALTMAMMVMMLLSSSTSVHAQKVIEMVRKRRISLYVVFLESLLTIKFVGTFALFCIHTSYDNIVNMVANG